MGIVPRHLFFVPEFHAEVVQALVQASLGFADVHQEVFAGGSYPVEAELMGDLFERVLVGAERDPGGPGEGAPVVKEVRDIFGIFYGLVGIGRHLLIPDLAGGGIRMAGEKKFTSPPPCNWYKMFVRGSREIFPDRIFLFTTSKKSVPFNRS
jgi:hypothetical protein